MKLFITVLLLTFVFCINAKAESDTLLITLKNNQVTKIAVSDIQKIRVENMSGINEAIPASKNLKLDGNFPNPFKDLTNIEFSISGSGNVVINIFDNTGKPVQTLKCDNCQSGTNTLLWNCLDFNQIRVQSGTYYYEVRFGNEVQSRKMIVIK